MTRALACAALLVLAACSTPPDERVERLVRICAASGLFKAVGGAAAIAVPVAALPIAVVNAGVDIVCANPERFVKDVGTADWLAKNLAQPKKDRSLRYRREGFQ